MVGHKMGEVEDDEAHTSERVDDNKYLNRKKRSCNKASSSRPIRGRRSWRHVELLLTEPSYSLKVGSVNVRYENRIRLRDLLLKLVAQHNWVDASGVLSALLKGTCRERSPQNNRIKYWVAMEVLRHVENNPTAYSTRIEHLYGTWREKIKAYKSWPTKVKNLYCICLRPSEGRCTKMCLVDVIEEKDRSLMLEYVLSCLARNNHDFARNNLHSLQEDHESASDPRSSLVIGLANYEFWYSDLPKEMRLENFDESCMHMELETMQYNSSKEIDSLNGEDATSILEKFSNLHYHSETSVANDKNVDANVSKRLGGEVFAATPVEHSLKVQSQDFYMKSFETSGENGVSTQDDYGRYHCSSAYNVHGLQSLLPIKVPSSENTMDAISSRRRYFGDYYKEAVKYLKLALLSPRPISEAALLPLVQLLLVGGQAKEAIVILEQFCNESSSVLSFRLKARLLECFDANHHDKLSVCFEDVMKKDPTCRHSLGRLLDLHQKGKYTPERLVEMIALHLEATYGDNILWREFASCLLKLCLCEEDRMSVCVDGERLESEPILRFCRAPASFVQGVSGRTWKFRCKWWLNRHFSRHTLASEMAEGDLQLMVSKAACASHLYGQQFDYVVRVHKYAIEHVDENDKLLLSFLDTHMQNSVGFFTNLVGK